MLSILVAVYSIGFYRLVNASKFCAGEALSQTLIWTGSIGLVLLWHSQIITKALMHWSGDSFYHLDPIEQFGLLAWSMLLIFILGWISALKTGRIEHQFRSKASISNRPSLATHLLDIIITLALFELFYAFSPQLYYGYYLIIFDDLPLQWIAPNDFSLSQTINRIAMHSIDKFSDLLAALTLWILVFQVVWRYLASSEKLNGSKKVVICGIIFGAASISLTLVN